MLRASACHNYSPEPPHDAAMSAEPLVHGLLLAETQPLCGPYAGESCALRRDPADLPQLGARSPTCPRIPPTGDAAANTRLTRHRFRLEALAPRSPLHCAVPPAQSCFAGANHLGLNLREARHAGESLAITMWKTATGDAQAGCVKGEQGG
ncbi:hypothetical protein GCM10010256_29570 [Streptomyces coeruleorubidus]|nr:hypothetical protein GCM10010256_29570 [Streptomyces coeruleorubidus]